MARRTAIDGDDGSSVVIVCSVIHRVRKGINYHTAVGCDLRLLHLHKGATSRGDTTRDATHIMGKSAELCHPGKSF
jgi:hypothetical protein